MNKIIDILRTFIGGCLLCYGAIFIVIGYAFLPRDMREILKGKANTKLDRIKEIAKWREMVDCDCVTCNDAVTILEIIGE